MWFVPSYPALYRFTPSVPISPFWQYNIKLLTYQKFNSYCITNTKIILLMKNIKKKYHYSFIVIHKIYT